MFDFLKRGRLVKRGLASRKKRRRRPQSELLRNLESSLYVKVFMFALFAGGLAFLVFSGQQPEPTKNYVIALLVLTTAITQLWINQPKSFEQNSRILLVFSVIFVQLTVTKLLLIVCNSGNYWFLRPEMGGLITPYAFAPLVLSVLLGRQHGLYAAFFVSLWSSMLFGPIDAPGTYHQSLVVANLSEAAAEAIGANGTLCRVCSYFHDVGKLVKPEYFTENMNFERNPHDDLAPTMSALIIIAHVKEGVDLALKHKLNQRIIDIIQEHHGTSLVYYFYQRALQQQEDARAGGKIMNMREEDIPEVGEESFRYSGPKPQTKESAIVSLADIVESASRSLEKPTPQKIEQLVNELIEERIADGQLDECDLTLGELRLIAERFRFTLMTMLHTRIAYPKAESKFAGGDEERFRPDVMASLRKPASAPPASAA